MKIILPHYVLTAMKALLFFHGIFDVSSLLQKRRHQTKLHRKTETRIGVAVQLVIEARSDPTRSVGLKAFEILYFAYFIYNGCKFLPHIIRSRSNGFAPESQRSPVDRVGQTVRAEAEVHKAA